MPEALRHRRADAVAAVAIIACVLVASLVTWFAGDLQQTTSIVAEPAPEAVAPADRVPATVRELWTAPSAATAVPVAGPATVVSADGSEVVGRAPRTGAPAWSYRRQLPLCTAASGFGAALAIYRRGDVCSEVTALDLTTGERGAQRNSSVRPVERLDVGRTYVVALDDTYLEVWRSDLVKTLHYGTVQTPAQPNQQPRPGCTYGSARPASGNLLAVLERCAGEAGDRLTVQRADPEWQDPEPPQEYFSAVLPVQGGVLVAATDQLVAVYEPGRLVTYDRSGARTAEFPLAVQLDPARPSMLVDELFWTTGPSVVALSPDDLRPQWSMGGALGTPALMAGRLLVPVPGGIVPVDPATGTADPLVPVDRAGYTGPVALAVVGGVVVEQRGSSIHALG